jgi:XTP/dITP diphosphohydrolase
MSEHAKPKRTLVLATTNRGKVVELISLLGDVPVEIRAIGDVITQPPDVDEDGTTFEQNAIKKALAAARATRLLALADDSGLEVDALDGQPGVRSARFARVGATAAENNAALIAALDALGDHASELTQYRARFLCVLALVDPIPAELRRWTIEGTCEGTIVRKPRGHNGFGYDPLFVPAGEDRTIAELDPEEKNRISHRARAVAALRPILRSLAEEIDVGTAPDNED